MENDSFYNKFKNPLAIVCFVIIAAGIFVYSQMKVELLPNTTFPKIKIVAENGDQPVEYTLVAVTQPLEQAIKKCENLQLLQSTTSRGSCEISAFFKWDGDINLARQQIEAAINEAKPDLPSGLKVEIQKMDPSTLAAAGYSLEGNLSPVELKTLAMYTVKPYLEQISGIRQVAVSGGRNKEYQVVLDAYKMSLLGITPSVVYDVLLQANTNSTSGYVNDGNRLYLMLTDASIHNKDQLENTIVRSSSSRVVKLKDIATVRIAGELEYVKIKANGKDVPILAVFNQPEANLSDVNSQLQYRVKILNDKMLPRGVSLKPFYNQADFVGDAISSIQDVLWIGLLLAIIVAIIFLRSFKSSLIIMITVPVSLLLTLVVMYLIGYNFNIMTLGAIAAAIGLVIDDAVVVVEQIHRTHEEHPEATYNKIVPKAIKYLFPAMVGSTLSTLLIFVPFRIMSGVAGSYFNIMTNTMMITLISSFFVSWLILPVFYLVFYGKTREKNLKPEEYKSKGWVYFFIKRPWLSILLSAGLVISMLLIFPILPSGFLPEMDEGTIVLDFDSPPGTSLETTEEMLQQVDEILDKTPEVESFSRRTGTQMGFFITEANRGDYLIKLKKKRGKSTEDVIDDIRGRIEQKIPALVVDFGQIIGDMIGDLMSSVQPIEIKLFGNDEKLIRQYSKLIASELEKVKGTADVFDGIVIAGPSITILPKYAVLKEFGMNTSDLDLQMKMQVNGLPVSSVQEGLRFCNVRMVYPGFESTGFDRLQTSKIFLPDGNLVPLKRFATIDVACGVAEINRENLKKVGYITARLNNRDLGSTLSDIRKAVERVHLPSGLNVEFGGTYKLQQQSFRELMLILVFAVLLIFILLLFMFRKVKVALLLIFLIMLAPAGSALLLYILGVPLNVGSYIGIIMIIGIVGEASIFTYMQYVNERQKGISVVDSIVYSISVRLRPKLMTALSAILALLPLALGIGTGAQMHQSLAISVIGGLIIALPVLLLILPSFLKLIEK